MIVWEFIKRRMWRVMLFACLLSIIPVTYFVHNATIPKTPWNVAFSMAYLLCTIAAPFFTFLGLWQDYIDMSKLKADMLRKLES